MTKKKAAHEEVFQKVHLSFFTSGLAKTLGPTKSMVLMGIASYMKNDGTCFPTHKQLSERTGISDKTIGKHVRGLINFRVNRKPILCATKYPTKAGNMNYAYKVMPISQLSKYEEGKVEKIDPIITKPELEEESELEKAIARLKQS
jgi:hypothetical protein